MKVAIVGSREGADLDHVRRFMHALWEHDPSTVVVSGGAKGVDTTAEQTWLGLGGQVISFRVKQLDYERYTAERWEIGCANPSVYTLVNEPVWADKVSALNYRNLLIAEECDRLVLFHKPRWRGGGGMTEESAREAYGKDTYVYEASVGA